MDTGFREILVHMPDDSCLEVSYYADDTTVSDSERPQKTKLFIQLQDCLSSQLIDRALSEQEDRLEHYVTQKVIHLKGDLC